jgi:hypothetical protein
VRRRRWVARVHAFDLGMLVKHYVVMRIRMSERKCMNVIICTYMQV